jgi:hypothetical protein
VNVNAGAAETPSRASQATGQGRSGIDRGGGVQTHGAGQPTLKCKWKVRLRCFNMQKSLIYTYGGAPKVVLSALPTPGYRPEYQMTGGPVAERHLS